MNDAKTIPALDAGQRRALRADAHHLDPVVAIAAKGLTATVLAEIDRNLKAHGLIKVRLYGIEREARAVICDEICATLGAAPVQMIGHLLVLWREPDADDETTVVAGRRKGGPRLTKKQAAAATDTKSARAATPVRRRRSQPS